RRRRRREEEEAKSRQKRFLAFTPDRRLSLPPGATLVLAVTFSMPLRRYPPEIFSSALRNATTASMAVSIPLTVSFDTLGVTSDFNRFGIFGLVRRRRRRRRRAAAGAKIGNDIVESGGERPAMYAALEDILARIGLPGKACLLRTVCEVFQGPQPNHGFFGEVLHMLLNPSRAPSEQLGLLEAYLEAEKVGRTTGDCSAYHTACPKSLYTEPDTYDGEYDEGYEDEEEEEEETCSLPGTRY
ncbi:uncharacterized protein LOC123498572, partial [Portunus trituberculatus]|uniref:uncharacterized protein LOC123498572 n=1 Tax=Portunus trituberculatus TaxID=210409 RepID=UPI001E1CE0A7